MKEAKKRVIDLWSDELFDYKTQNYSEILSDVNYVLDTVGESELEKEFKILKSGVVLVSLKDYQTKNLQKERVYLLLKKICLNLQEQNMIN